MEAVLWLIKRVYVFDSHPVDSLSSAEVIMIIKYQVSVSSLLLNIPKAKNRKITSAE